MVGTFFCHKRGAPCGTLFVWAYGRTLFPVLLSIIKQRCHETMNFSKMYFYLEWICIRNSTVDKLFSLMFFSCCNTCEDVKKAYELKRWSLVEIDKVEQCRSTQDAEKVARALKEGCQIYGYLEVNRVSWCIYFNTLYKVEPLISGHHGLSFWSDTTNLL